VGKITEKAVCRSVFLITWHCIWSAELTKTHSYRLFFWRFCHWVRIRRLMIFFLSLYIIFQENQTRRKMVTIYAQLKLQIKQARLICLYGMNMARLYNLVISLDSRRGMN